MMSVFDACKTSGERNDLKYFYIVFRLKPAKYRAAEKLASQLMTPTFNNT